MDQTQTDHLKAYGIAYWSLKQGENVDWLLNYRGGSFILNHDGKILISSIVEIGTPTLPTSPTDNS